MATIPLAHFAICKLQENCKSSPFSETALIFIHLKRCTIEILGRQRHFQLKSAYFPNGDAILLVRFPRLGQASASLLQHVSRGCSALAPVVVSRRDSQRLCVQRVGNSCISAALTAAIMLFPALGVPEIEQA